MGVELAVELEDPPPPPQAIKAKLRLAAIEAFVISLNERIVVMLGLDVPYNLKWWIVFAPIIYIYFL